MMEDETMKLPVTKEVSDQSLSSVLLNGQPSPQWHLTRSGKCIKDAQLSYFNQLLMVFAHPSVGITLFEDFYVA